MVPPPGFAGTVVRVLIELIDLAPQRASSQARDIHSALDRAGVTAPRLQRGEGEATWPMLREALDRGLDTRIGLEDTLELPDGRHSAGNADLVRAAMDRLALRLFVELRTPPSRAVVGRAVIRLPRLGSD